MKTIILAALATTMMSFENPERQRDIEQHFSTQAAERIELRGFNSSDIKIRSWDKNEVSVKLSISFSSSDQKDEQRYLDAITLKHEESRELLRITLQEPDMTSKNRGSFWSWIKKFFTGSFISKRVEGEIYVPQSNPLLAEVRYGSISLDGMKGPLNCPGRETRSFFATARTSGKSPTITGKRPSSAAAELFSSHARAGQSASISSTAKRISKPIIQISPCVTYHDPSRSIHQAARPKWSMWAATPPFGPTIPRSPQTTSRGCWIFRTKAGK